MPAGTTGKVACLNGIQQGKFGHKPHIMRSQLLFLFLVMLTANLVSCTVEGCTNPLAINFNIEANADDGSCQIEGCTDAVAPNYNPEANVEDGSCEPIPCPEGNKAILKVYNYTICTPDVVVNGEIVVNDLGPSTMDGVPGDSVIVELDEGTYTIFADLPLIAACIEDSITFETVCGESYTWSFQ